MDILHWQDAYGISPYQEWVKNNGDSGRMAESMVACLKHQELKCKFVKQLKPKSMKLYELKSKSTDVRVYFCKNSKINTAYILGAGYKDTQKEDIEDALERMEGIEYD